jgi:hypothetical protein
VSAKRTKRTDNSWNHISFLGQGFKLRLVQTRQVNACLISIKHSFFSLLPLPPHSILSPMVNVTYDAGVLLFSWFFKIKKSIHFVFQPITWWHTSRMAHQSSTASATCRLSYVQWLSCLSWFQELGSFILVSYGGRMRCPWYTSLWLQSRSFRSKYVPSRPSIVPWTLVYNLYYLFSGFSGDIH